MVGVAVASADGSFGYIRQLVVDPGFGDVGGVEAALKTQIADELASRGISDVRIFGGEAVGTAGFRIMNSM